MTTPTPIPQDPKNQRIGMVTIAVIFGVLWLISQLIESREEASFKKAMEPRYTWAEVQAMTCQDFVDDTYGGQADAIEAVIGRNPDGNPHFSDINLRVLRACHGEDLYVDGRLIFHPTTGMLVPNILGATRAYTTEWAPKPPPTTRPVLKP